jgi:hypothetical protein
MAELPPHPSLTCGRGTLHNPPLKFIPPPEGVTIGKFCALGPNLKIIGTNHDYNYPAIQYTFYRKYFDQEHPADPESRTHSKGAIRIGNDVWIGEDVTLLSGVTIGDGVCIGAGSIVTRDLEPYSICAGTPCRTIKKRYSEEVIRYLQELKWWDWSDEVIRANRRFFQTNLNRSSLPEIRASVLT